MEPSPAKRPRLVASNSAPLYDKPKSPTTTNHPGRPPLAANRSPACDLPTELWSQIAEGLTPTDFLSLTETSSNLRALQKNQHVMHRVATNSQIVSPVQIEMREPAYRLPQAPDASLLRAEAHLIARLARGPIVLNSFSSNHRLKLAPSKLHVALFDAWAKQTTVVPLYSELAPMQTFAAEEANWTFFGAEAFEWIAQDSAQGPIWLHDLRSRAKPKRCIAPFAADNSLNAVAVPGRLAFWVSYSTPEEIKLFEPDASGTFCAVRRVATECLVELQQSSWLGDRLVWRSWRANAVQLVEIKPSGQWDSLFHVGLSGCDCESMWLSKDGQIAHAEPCGSDFLVALGTDGGTSTQALDVTLPGGIAWIAPNGASAVVPAGRGYKVHDLPSLNLSYETDEGGLPPWMRAHLAWQRCGPLIQAEELCDLTTRNEVPVVVDAHVHGDIAWSREVFRFPKQTSLGTYEVAAGETGALEDINFDPQLKSVIYSLEFKDDREGAKMSTASISAAAIIEQGVELSYRDRWF